MPQTHRALDTAGLHRTVMLHDRYEPFKRLAMVQIHPPPNPNKPLTPFSISDILNGRVGRRSGVTHPSGRSNHVQSTGHHVHFPTQPRFARMHPLRVRTPITSPTDTRRFLRPWDDAASPCSSNSDENDEEIDIEDEKPPQGKSGVSPLDALFQMTSKTFDGRGPDGQLQEGMSIFTDI